MNYYLTNIQEDVVVQVNGTCPSNLAISDYDLCTIVSNAITNAVEGVTRQIDKDKKIIINMTYEENGFVIKIWNTCNPIEIIDEKNQYSTLKIDKKAHGFGLKNIKETVEKNMGKLIYGNERNGFELIVHLPRKNEVGLTVRRVISPFKEL